MTRVFGALVRRRCIRYSALLLRGERAQTAFYVFDGELWGFGLMRPGARPVSLARRASDRARATTNGTTSRVGRPTATHITA